MDDLAAWQRLLLWFSPAFPIGGFGWSGGLESAIAAGRVRDRLGMGHWLDGLLHAGGPRNDAILLAHAWRRHDDEAMLAELSELSLAFISAPSRRMESEQMGQAFSRSAETWRGLVPPPLPTPCPFPIALGAWAARGGIGLGESLAGWLGLAAQGQISVGIRLIPLGQSDGLALLADLEETITRLSRQYAQAGLDQLGGIAQAADMDALSHATLKTRVFRS